MCNLDKALDYEIEMTPSDCSKTELLKVRALADLLTGQQKGQDPAHTSCSKDYRLWTVIFIWSTICLWCWINIYTLSVTALSLLWGCKVFCWSQSQLSLGEGGVLPGQVASSSQGPSLLGEAAMQGVNHTLGAIWSSVACCLQLSSCWSVSLELGLELATFRSLADLLSQLSYSHPFVEYTA